MAQAPPASVEWSLFDSSGPQLAFHVGAVIAGAFYVHGGISVAGSTQPLNLLYKFTPAITTGVDDANNGNTGGVWTELTAANSPHLSHHACLGITDRYLVVIGGWTGKQRCSDVFIFDTRAKEWSKPECTGFPSGAGLSSHTATELANGDILIIGREGSLRTQRRSGNAFILRGSVDLRRFCYTDFPIAVASRSGHTTVAVRSKIVIIGGRDDRLIEQHAVKPVYHKTESVKPIRSGSNSDLVTSLVAKTNALKPLSKIPSGRKNHISIRGDGGILIHGGETFNGRAREPVARMYLVKLSPPTTFYDLGASKIGRAGHVAVTTTDPNDVYIHGGLGPRNKVTREMFKLASTF
ncbi:kelch domain-containing protein 9-like [Tubulanus polymorphus]|uniref:kelch domain-containing protein 9-like n=1 Tax=Tubulanus polymorphus TaxID=672921 RepID=UPI003DA1CECC